MGSQFLMYFVRFYPSNRFVILFSITYNIIDLDECNSPDLNDCHPLGKCTNMFGTFQCSCPDGYRDPWIGNAHRSGRTCETCDPGQCNLRGECFFQAGQPVCK